MNTKAIILVAAVVTAATSLVSPMSATTRTDTLCDTGWRNYLVNPPLWCDTGSMAEGEALCGYIRDNFCGGKVTLGAWDTCYNTPAGTSAHCCWGSSQDCAM